MSDPVKPSVAELKSEQNYVNPDHPLERINLILPHFEDDAPSLPPVAAVTAASLAPSAAVSGTSRSNRRWYIAAGAAVIFGLLGYGIYWSSKPMPVAVVTSPKPKPTTVPTVSPAPAASVAPTPSPTPIPVNTAVSAPAAVPTADHPQTVKITSKSGLWLRSSPNSSNRSNIINWMANGSTVSVDAVGDFWWHGTFKGQPGYFAVNYTQ